MALQYFAPKPSTDVYVMWDGTNLQEILDLVTAGFIPATVVDNEDGTLTVNNYLVTQGTYLNRMGSITDMSYFQEVADIDVIYVFE